MGRGSYLGGHAVTNGRQSAREEWEGPKYQSAMSARLLGDPDPLVAELGERLLELERGLSMALQDIKIKLDPDFSRRTLDAYMRSRPETDQASMLKTFTESAQHDVEKQQAKVADLSAEISRITTLAADTVGNRSEIAGYMKELGKR